MRHTKRIKMIQRKAYPMQVLVSDMADSIAMKLIDWIENVRQKVLSLKIE